MAGVTVTEITKTGASQITAQTRVYTPDSPLRSPLALLRTMLADLRAVRILAWRLAVRDISAQYRQTSIGYIWAGLPAVASALVWVALNAAGVITVKTGGVPYIAYVLAGTMFWQLFLDSLNAPLTQLNQNRTMLNRVNFPTEAIFASGVIQVLFSFTVKLVVLAAVLALSGAPVQWTAPAILLPAVALLLFGTVLGVLLTPVGMLFQDVQQGLNAVVAPLMFLTPVIYSLNSQTGISHGIIGTIMRKNPLTPMFEVMRELLFGGVGPYVGELAIVTAATLVLAGVGWLVYRVSLPIIVERIEA